VLSFASGSWRAEQGAGNQHEIMKVITYWPVRQRCQRLNWRRLGSIEDPLRRLLPDPQISALERDGEKTNTQIYPCKHLTVSLLAVFFLQISSADVSNKKGPLRGNVKGL